MINDIISNLIIAFDDFITQLGLYTKITTLIGYLDDFATYTTEFNKYLSGVYFILGKSLVVYIVTCFALIVIIRIIFAVINLVGQFVP